MSCCFNPYLLVFDSKEQPISSGTRKTQNKEIIKRLVAHFPKVTELIFS